MNPQGILSIEEKADLVGKDLLGVAEAASSNLYFNNTPFLDLYLPSKKLLEIMDEHEIVAALEYLKKQYCLSYEVKTRNFGSGSDAYAITLDISHLDATIKRHETERELARTNKLPHLEPNVHVGIDFDSVRSTLTVNGKEILLGKSLGDKTFQYWICYHTMKKPNKSVNEVKILDSYSKDFGEQARNRAIRDAVYDLNDKLKTKAQQDNKLFLYSRGKVTYVEDNFSFAKGFSVNL